MAAPAFRHHPGGRTSCLLRPQDHLLRPDAVGGSDTQLHHSSIQGGDPAEAIVQRIAGSNQVGRPPPDRGDPPNAGRTGCAALQQYIDYLGSILHGEFGISYSYMPYTVTHMIGEAFPGRCALVGVTQSSRSSSAPLGTWAAWRRNSKFDTILTMAPVSSAPSPSSGSR